MRNILEENVIIVAEKKEWLLDVQLSEQEMIISGEALVQLWKEADPRTGFWRQGCGGNERPIFHSLAGSFHYLFNHENAASPLRYPEKMIYSCLEIWEDYKVNNPVFGNNICFADVD